ncbi:c-type cytochrome [Vibrio methylphosphonaticus]|uniref:c-type cytochrome n=1 Tax=Vibrio methylphosphonaticus TaxID=2946866 RepID=UPI00202AA5D2|nr:cytochrome c [Vibrio methylphosphonaticus]MCL9776857.1 cytochrome c [Vibrio methylphosphonaticus]
MTIKKLGLKSVQATRVAPFSQWLMAAVLVASSVTVTGAMASENTIEQRQAAFSDIESNTKAAAKMIDGDKTDWAALLVMSEQLVASGDVVSNAFVAGSDEGGKAKSDVWEKPEKFERLMLEMNDGYQSLLAAAQHQDAKKAQQAIKSAESTCRSCHRSYRARW